MNKKTFSLGIMLGLLLSAPAIAADYNSFLTPSSLGKDVKTLSSQYKLGLKKQNGSSYNNSDAYDCNVNVSVNSRNLITHIKISPNTEKCDYKATSSGVNFNSKTTKAVDILNQAKLSDIKFIPGCFNCPSRIELPDSLVVNKDQDNYYTEFEIGGYNSEYLKFMGKKLLGSFSEDDYYPTMDKLETKLGSSPSSYNRKDFKLKAIQTYDLQQQPWNYAIGLK
ncbi:hypothetical protein [Psychrobacter sp. Sarcosine-3u-12]|uniref:hypothetical protein n=1 Tax=Psychrobacter sp. Sarcosine-3u-12 TaxID=2058325 RepID=UPI000C33B512|nr:hypothetical protein [Psychrobacter sp. Sarcosine-3u-12]PKG34153.1 hypothetical protein CXF65_14315 [Psychrobacter sp. Sarcosine-3u-12]